jgi:hypothetical protein
MTPRTPRTPLKHALLGGAIVGALVAGALTLPALALRDRLPDPVATHWNGGSTPDGSTGLLAHVLMALALWAVLLAVQLGLAAQGRLFARRLSRTYWWASLAGGAALLLGMEVTTLGANLDRASWKEAELPVWAVLAVLAVTVLAGVLAGLLARGGPDQVVPTGEEAPRLRLRPGQRSVWVSRVTNSWLLLLSALSLAVLVVLGVTALSGVLPAAVGASVLPGAALILLVGLLATSVGVRVSEDGVAIGFGPLGWPVRRIRLSKIESAWTEERFPSQVGGWGLRGVPGSAAIMLRGGECLVLRYRSGGQLVISIDDAARGAALINALIEERVAA